MRRACAFALLSGLAGPSAAHADAAAVGRALFQGQQAFAAGAGATMAHLPVAFAACANCHGPRGAGQREGGTDVPGVTRDALSASRGPVAGYATDADILAAVALGVGRDGRSLSPQMPRYKLSDDESDAILAYLRTLGTVDDVPPGVTRTELRIGLLLPLSGARAGQGQAVLSAVREVVEASNQAGGIHGRTVDLIVVDSTVPHALRVLLDQEVFALIGSMWDAKDAQIEAAFAAAQVSVLASLVQRDDEVTPGGWVADLLPPRNMQRQVLAAAVATCPVSGPRWLITDATAPVPGVEAVDPVTAVGLLAGDVGVSDGCLGVALSDMDTVGAVIPAGWSRRIGLPFPRQVLETGGVRIWQTLGQAAAHVGLEALAVAGASLYERAPLDALARLDGFEPVPGVPVRYGPTRWFGWDADVLKDDRDAVADISRTAIGVVAH